MTYSRHQFNLIPVGVLVVVLAAFLCHAQTHVEHRATENALKATLRQYLQDQRVENHENFRYIAAFVDLNDDGVDEVVVHVIHRSLCGTGGCPTLVLAPTESSYRIVSRIPITRPAIRVLNRKSNGWHDLTVWVQGGGIMPGYEADLPFDGETYAANPTVLPAHRVSSKASGRVLISDKAVGIPLN